MGGDAERSAAGEPPQGAGNLLGRASCRMVAAEKRAALDGVDTLFLVPGRESPGRVAQHATAVDAAVAAGVRRIVDLSFLGAAPDAAFTLARQPGLRLPGGRATPI